MVDRIAVIGAGLAGLTCARTLADAGRRVTVFDKARGPAGRMSTRREGADAFDHGAQYFTVRDLRFEHAVTEWAAAGIAAEWKGRLVMLDRGSTVPALPAARWVGTPGMNAIPKHLAATLDVRCPVRVDRLEPASGGWRLRGDVGAGDSEFGAVVVAVPAVQALPLLAPASGLVAQANRVYLRPCWAVMLAFEEPLDIRFDGAFVEQSPLAWIARNASKPGRPPRETWVLHASAAWSEAHLEAEPGRVVNDLLAAFGAATGLGRVEPTTAVAHRWRYAMVADPLGTGCFLDADLQLGVCGDWCVSARVEGAYLSGLAMAERLLGR